MVSPEIKFVGIPKGTIQEQLAMNIKMVGSISELLIGNIVALYATVKIRHTPEKVALYKEQFLFTPFVNQGDSGALFFDYNDYVVGLVSAGTLISSLIYYQYYINLLSILYKIIQL